MRFHHIGYAVHDLSKAMKIFSALGFSPGEYIRDINRGIDILFMENQDKLLIELIAPAAMENPVSGILKRMGPSPYHFCFMADSRKELKNFIAANGCSILKDAEAAPALGSDIMVEFLHSPQLGIIEIAIADEDRNNAA